MKELCGGRIVYAPWTDRDAYIQNALLLVLPLDKPDVELRLITAAAWGKALLATSSALQGFQVSEDNVFCEANVNALVERLIALLRNPTLLEQSGKAIAQWYNVNWTAPILQNRLTEIFENTGSEPNMNKRSSCPDRRRTCSGKTTIARAIGMRQETT
jgi:glycosyltransferase involved in cell wall biosynthesis